MPNDNVNDSKIVKNVNILPKITSIVKDTLVDSGAPIIDDANVSSNNISDDV